MDQLGRQIIDKVYSDADFGFCDGEPCDGLNGYYQYLANVALENDISLNNYNDQFWPLLLESTAGFSGGSLFNNNSLTQSGNTITMAGTPYLTLVDTSTGGASITINQQSNSTTLTFNGTSGIWGLKFDPIDYEIRIALDDLSLKQQWVIADMLPNESYTTRVRAVLAKNDGTILLSPWSSDTFTTPNPIPTYTDDSYVTAPLNITKKVAKPFTTGTVKNITTKARSFFTKVFTTKKSKSRVEKREEKQVIKDLLAKPENDKKKALEEIAAGKRPRSL